MSIYIAGPFSTKREKETLKHMIELINKRYPGYNLYVPMDYKVPGDFQKLDGTWNLPNTEWAKRVYENDVKELDKAEMVFAMYVGHYCTSGTIWEVGYACGKGIPVIIYIPEWVEEDVSLMVMNGITRRITEDGLIISITEDYLSQFNQK